MARGGIDPGLKRWDELAQALGIDAAGLAAQVSRFNSFVETGHDLDFQPRAASALPRLQTAMQNTRRTRCWVRSASPRTGV